VHWKFYDDDDDDADDDADDDDDDGIEQQFHKTECWNMTFEWI